MLVFTGNSLFCFEFCKQIVNVENLKFSGGSLICLEICKAIANSENLKC